MKQYWKYYLKTAAGSVVCTLLPWVCQILWPPEDPWTWLFVWFIFSPFFAIISLLGSSLYLLRKGVPRGWRVLFFFLNPALYYLVLAFFTWLSMI